MNSALHAFGRLSNTPFILHISTDDIMGRESEMTGRRQTPRCPCVMWLIEGNLRLPRRPPAELGTPRNDPAQRGTSLRSAWVSLRNSRWDGLILGVPPWWGGMRFHRAHGRAPLRFNAGGKTRAVYARTKVQASDLIDNGGYSPNASESIILNFFLRAVYE